MDVLEVCINHLIVDTKQTSVREMLPLRQTCKHLCDFVGDFLTTLNFSIKDSNGQYWQYDDDPDNTRVYYPSYPLTFRLRHIKSVVFGGFVPSRVGYALAAAATIWNWSVERVEVRLLDIGKGGYRYDATKCREAAGAFLRDLQNLPSLKLTVNASTREQVQDYDPCHSDCKVDISGLQELSLDAAEAGGVHSLSLYGVLQLEGVIPALVAAPTPFWENLKELEISYGEVDDILAAAVPHLTRLSTLILIFCDIGDQASDVFLHAPAMHELRVLKIGCNNFTSETSQASFLQAIQRCELLEELWLDLGNIDSQALLEILESLHHLQHLRVLAVDAWSKNNTCSEKIAQIVVNLPRLETLLLDGIFETDDNIGAARILGGATRVSRLRVLSTTWNDSTCVEALLGGSASWLDTVEELYLETRQGIEDCVSALIIRAAPRLRSLKALGIVAFDENALMKIRLAMPTVNVFSPDYTSVYRLWISL